MRRIVLLLLCGTALLAPAPICQVQAKERPGPTRPGLVTAAPGPGTQRALPEGQSAPERILGSPNGQSADALRIPAGAFSPATLSQYVGVADNAAADQSYFSLFHSARYSDSGRTGGFYQRADWNDVAFRYLASIFGSPSDASNALHDGESHTQAASGSDLADCSTHYQAPCGSLHYVTTAANAGQYIVIQVNQCLVEIAASAPAATWNSQTEQIVQTTETIAAAGLQAARVVCAAGPPAPQAATAPSPSLSIDQILLGHTVKGHLKLTRVLLSREKGLFAVYYHAGSADSAKPSATIAFSADGKIISSDVMEPATLADGTPYFASEDSFTAQKHAIHIVARITLTVGATTATGSIDFTVKPRKQT